VVTHQLQSLLSRKMHLESKWNQLFLENSGETPDMKWIDLELKKVRLSMREIQNMMAREEILESYNIAS
jgi:hypothetical protein